MVLANPSALAAAPGRPDLLAQKQGLRLKMGQLGPAQSCFLDWNSTLANQYNNKTKNFARGSKADFGGGC